MDGFVTFFGDNMESLTRFKSCLVVVQVVDVSSHDL